MNPPRRLPRTMEPNLLYNLVMSILMCTHTLSHHLPQTIFLVILTTPLIRILTRKLQCMCQTTQLRMGQWKRILLHNMLLIQAFTYHTHGHPLSNSSLFLFRLCNIQRSNLLLRRSRHRHRSILLLRLLCRLTDHTLCLCPDTFLSPLTFHTFKPHLLHRTMDTIRVMDT
ncbi:hypothetical protein BDR07DRAFT_731223 [Suillus spraguei]|nr:hypothetical protein BDR07DRAFT_731223 [Suillus spraguei]